MRRLPAMSGFVWLCAAVAACGDAASTDARAPTDGSSGDGMSLDAAIDVAATDALDAMDDVAPVRCGTRTCLTGESCVMGMCRCVGNPCEAACCTGGAVCYLGACTTPGAVCMRTAQCPTGSYCEATLSRCLPTAMGATCEYRPPAGRFRPERMWGWPQPATTGATFYQIISTPLVVPLAAPAPDGAPVIPSVVFLAGTDFNTLHLRAVRGDTGADIFHATDDVFVGQSQIAAGDLDGDGRIEIVGIVGGTNPAYCDLGAGARLAAFGPDGRRLWISSETVSAGIAAPAIADVDGDGRAEILVGATMFDAMGNVRWRSPDGRGTDGCAQAGAVNILADVVPGNGVLEAIIGSSVYRGDTGVLLWRAMRMGMRVPGGLTAVADFNRDDQPEIVIVHGANNGLSIVDGVTGASRCTVAAPVSSTLGGGPPVVANFAGDVRPEIGVVFRNMYVVYDGQCMELWRHPVSDDSAQTSSSVFDFEGDGEAEVVYTNETQVVVLRGRDGMVLFTLDHRSATGMENPVVADIDADGHTEIVAVGQQLPFSLEAFRDTDRNWVASRGIWNQHAYHVTNVDDTGSIPRRERDSWAATGVNTYRANIQITGAFEVPDLTVRDLVIDVSACPNTVAVSARVFNLGSRGVLPPVSVTFTFRPPTGAVMTAMASTTRTLLPGQGERLRVEFMIPMGPLGMYEATAEVDPDSGSGFGRVRECNEMNNRAGPARAECAAPN